jgi:hypothetical protein
MAGNSSAERWMARYESGIWLGTCPRNACYRHGSTRKLPTRDSLLVGLLNSWHTVPHNEDAAGTAHKKPRQRVTVNAVFFCASREPARGKDIEGLQSEPGQFSKKTLHAPVPYRRGSIASETRA